MSETVHASAKTSTAVTPSDSTVVHCKALYIGGGGNVAFRHNANDSTVTYVGLTAGSILPVESGPDGARVMAATTATSIVAMVW